MQESYEAVSFNIFHRFRTVSSTRCEARQERCKKMPSFEKWFSAFW